MPKAVTLTMNPALDLSAVADEITPNEKTRCADAKEDPGGGGINVARALHRLGGEVLAVFPCGGVYGQRVKELVEEEEVPCKLIDIAGLTRVNPAIRQKGEGGDQYHFTLPGPELSRDDQRRCLEAVEEALEENDLFVASGSLPQGVADEFYKTAVERAGGAGAKVILDAAGGLLKAAVEASPAWIKPNRNELAELLEIDADDEAIEKRATEFVSEEGEMRILLSLGKEGACCIEPGGRERIEGPSVKVRSRTGTGDTMVAGLVHALLKGKEPVEACRWAVAAGSAAVMTEGTELLRVEDFEELLDKMKG